METFSIQNNAVIKELYKHHKKDLIFAGMVAFAASMEPVKRQKNAMIAANIICNILGADGILLNKVHGGMPQVDLALVAETCEDLGVKTSLFVQLWGSHGSLSDGLLFGSTSLNAVVNTGRITERIQLPCADKIIGGDDGSTIYNPDFHQRAGDGILEIEGMLLAGFHDFIGGDKIIAAQY